MINKYTCKSKLRNNKLKQELLPLNTLSNFNKVHSVPLLVHIFYIIIYNYVYNLTFTKKITYKFISCMPYE